MPINATRSRPRLRERFSTRGASALCHVDLLALLIGTGSRKQSASELAALLIAEHGLESLGTLRPHELMRTSGIGLGVACRIAAAFELGKRWQRAAVESTEPRPRIDTSKDAHAVLRDITLGSDVENLLVLGLDARRHLLFVERVAIGGLSSCVALPCDVFRLAVRHGASAVIVAHNHPSGDEEPSPDDFVFTDRLRRAGTAVGIDVLDHLVLGRGVYFSFADHDLFS